LTEIKEWPFNGRLRDEFVNEQPFTSHRHAREIIEEGRIDDNLSRPHTSLDGHTNRVCKPVPKGPQPDSPCE